MPASHGAETGEAGVLRLSLGTESGQRLADRKPFTKLGKRKHMAGGSRVARVCVCEDYVPDSVKLHVPQLWPYSRRAVCGRRSHGRRQWANPSFRAGKLGKFYRSSVPLLKLKDELLRENSSPSD